MKFRYFFCDLDSVLAAGLDSVVAGAAGFGESFVFVSLVDAPLSVDRHQGEGLVPGRPWTWSHLVLPAAVQGGEFLPAHRDGGLAVLTRELLGHRGQRGSPGGNLYLRARLPQPAGGGGQVLPRDRMVMRDRELLTMDEMAVIEEANRESSLLRERAGA